MELASTFPMSGDTLVSHFFVFMGKEIAVWLKFYNRVANATFVFICSHVKYLGVRLGLPISASRKLKF